jgi:hypothetical protein
MRPLWNYTPSDKAKTAKEIDMPLLSRDIELGPIHAATGNDEVPSTAASFPERPYAWTNVHSFLTLMGGFAVDTSLLHAKQKYLPGNRERVVLPPPVILYLAEYEPSLIPNISTADIEDKSKASSLAKAIVCVQAAWFCTQCIFRLFEGLSISLLELSTFGHSLCAMLMYVLWWNKPLDIEQPILLTSERAHHLCATFCFHSRFDGLTDKVTLGFRKRPGDGSGLHQVSDSVCEPVDTEERLYRFEEIQISDLVHVEWYDISNMKAARDQSSMFQKENLLALQTTLRKTREECGRTNSPLSTGTRERASTSEALKSIPEPPEQCDQREWNRWYMALSTERSGSDTPLIVFRRIFDTDEFALRELNVSDRMRNWPKDFDFTAIIDSTMYLPMMPSLEDGELALLVGFFLSGAVYGGLHLLAWKAPFTSHVQQLLWRISGLAITASGFFLLSLKIFCGLISSVWENFFAVTEKRPTRTIGFRWRLAYFVRSSTQSIVYLLLVAGGLLYVFARVYLFVEYFIALAYLPRSVFEQPRWVGYFPHIQ